MVATYFNRDKYGVPEDMWVIWKGDKRVNSIDHWCIVFFHINFRSM